MKIGILGDVHATKNMRNLQTQWENSVTQSIKSAYETFLAEGVSQVVFLGDFFDSPKIEAKHMHFILPLLEYINSQESISTWMLLGNHEIDDDSHNILDILNEYNHINPVTTYTEVQDRVYVPYNFPLEEANIKDKYVFSHHDIYGSALAGGLTKAFFGIDPELLKDAKRVFNGHVHLKSKPRKNIYNCGALCISAQGELRLGDYPTYHILDTDTDHLSDYANTESLIYVTTDNISSLDKYDHSKVSLRFDYEGDLPEISEGAYMSMTFRKKLGDLSETTEIIEHTESSIDLKNYLTDYISNDDSVPKELKEMYIQEGLALLG